MSNKVIEFSIPDFYNYFQLNLNLLTLMKKQPGLFMEDVKITSVYGSFPGCIWNSGRAILGQATFENIIATVKAFNDLGISVRYTFTNSLITGMHLMDYYCNTILQITESEMNGVNVNKDILNNHVAKSFPKFYRMWSTTKDTKTVEEVNKLSADQLTVLYYGMNNTDALDQLEHPENIEVLVSEACIENCPNRQDHYADISKLQLIQPSVGFRCPHGCEQYYYYELPVKRRHYVSPDDIRNIYLPRGIYQFKIGGRNDSIINVIENYVNYFAKPEHRDNVRNILLNVHFSGRQLFLEDQQQYQQQNNHY